MHGVQAPPALGAVLSSEFSVCIQLPGELASMSSKRGCHGILDVRP